MALLSLFRLAPPDHEAAVDAWDGQPQPAGCTDHDADPDAGYDEDEDLLDSLGFTYGGGFPDVG